MGKPVRIINLEGDSIETLIQGETDKNPTRVTWQAPIPRQNMYIFKEEEDGALTPKYQTVADGTEGFPLSYNQKDKDGIFLNPGDTCRLFFWRTEQFSGPFTIPAKGNN